VPAYVSRGEAYSEQGDHERAIADFTQALTLNPRHALAYYNRAVAWFFQHNYPKAWADVKRFQQMGGKPDPQFMRDLSKASGRRERRPGR
jgi:tetratricopeptide (TPR) repeat protein